MRFPIESACILLAGLPVTSESALGGDPWADAVVDHSPNLDGSGLLNDPAAALDEPSRTFFDPIYQAQYRTSLVVGSYNLTDPDGRKVVLRLDPGDFVKLRFDEPVEDDPANAFGVDLLVFGNAFFTSDRFIAPDTDMQAVRLTGSVFAETITVAVSASGTGDPSSHPDEWYTYASGPTGDGLFPTNAYEWNRCSRNWGRRRNYTKPVDPELSVDDFRGLSAADAMRLYGASGGGAGFDLAESGFRSIRFVYLTGAGGEVDGLADVSAGAIAPADLDVDGDVDLIDAGRLYRCFTGGGKVTECSCAPADLDGDDDVDLADAAALAAALTGPR